MERLASGRRIHSAADAPAGFVRSQRLEARTRSTQQARRNTSHGRSVVRIGEAALGETSGLLLRIRELAVQSGNGTLRDAERSAIGEEAEALLDGVDRIAQTTRFGSKRLLDGTTDLSIVSDVDATGPVAVSAVSIVSKSRISPARITSGIRGAPTGDRGPAGGRRERPGL